MGRPKIGDSLFIYGSDLKEIEEFDEFEYNTVSGYATIGYYDVIAVESDTESASIPGFVVDFESTRCLTPPTPFLSVELIDVTDKLSLKSPRLLGSRVWMYYHPSRLF